MKREDTRAAYYEFSGKLSDIVRQLSFAGIAIIWVFKVDQKTGTSVPRELVLPALLLVASLASDALQYAYQTAAWGLFNRRLELRRVSEEDNFSAPPAINVPANILFWLKVVLLAAAYALLLMFLGRRLVV